MGKDTKKYYIIELLLTVILTIYTLLSFSINKWFMAVIIMISAIIVFVFCKRKRILKIKKQKVLIIMIIFGLLYVALFYMMGLYTGFYNQTNYLNIKTIFNTIIPIIIIIITTELIRDKLLSLNTNKSKILVTIIGVLSDISIYLDLYGFSNLESFLGLLGFVIFSAIANNLLYTYICSRYGYKPVVVYKLITVLYLYIIPITPKVYIYFRTFIRMIYPLIIYFYLEKYFNMDKDRISNKSSRNQIVSMLITSIIIILIIALISCKFLYCALVIGSKSMTGSINKGDVVIYKDTKKGIKLGDVIVFERDDTRIVHRIISIKKNNKEIRYYTKGDANLVQDDWYVTNDTLRGKVLFKIRYIGKPTLWLRELFNKEG